MTPFIHATSSTLPPRRTRKSCKQFWLRQRRRACVGFSIAELLISTVIVGVGYTGISTLNAISARSIKSFMVQEDNTKRSSGIVGADTQTLDRPIDSLSCFRYNSGTYSGQDTCTPLDSPSGTANLIAWWNPEVVFSATSHVNSQSAGRIQDFYVEQEALNYFVRACYSTSSAPVPPLVGLSDLTDSQWNTINNTPSLRAEYASKGSLLAVLAAGRVEIPKQANTADRFKGAEDEQFRQRIVAAGSEIDNPGTPPFGHRVFFSERYSDGDQDPSNNDIISWLTAAPMASTFCP